MMLQQINRSSEVVSQTPIILVQHFIIGRNRTHRYKAFSDGYMSWKHCVLSTENDNWFIVDCSNNGVWRRAVGSDFKKLVKKRRYILNDNDEIQISDTLFYKFMVDGRSTADVEECVKKPLGQPSASNNDFAVLGVCGKSQIDSTCLNLQPEEELECHPPLENVYKNAVNHNEEQIKNLKNQIEGARMIGNLLLKRSNKLSDKLRLEFNSGETLLPLKLPCELNSIKLSTSLEVLKCQKETEEWKNKFNDLEKEHKALEDQKKSLEDEKRMIENEKQALEKEKQAFEKEKQSLETHVEVVKAIALENQLEKFEELIENEARCAICFEIVIQPASINCGHVFCEKCINEWKLKTPRCPTCRAKIRRLTRVTMVDSLLAKITDNLTGDFKRKRSQVVDERSEKDGSVVPPKRQCVVQTNTPIFEPQGFIIDFSTDLDLRLHEIREQVTAQII